ncbi:unnamed protein product [Gongylonema pulchrum]|uniref:MFS domain-containing protein n=1 Tax=Gongylonema pulchrum TaxID=637853 RepID=A0A183EUE5_9BILA|nr:unnamed protein product [Gongylonema pulchrum]
MEHVESEVKSAMNSQAGYSFFMALGATIGAVIDIFVGSLSVFFAKHCL